MKEKLKHLLADIKAKFKGVRKSWTMKFNALLLAALPVLLYLQDSLPMLRDFMDISTYQHVGLIVVAVNMALRFRTDKSLKDK